MSYLGKLLENVEVEWKTLRDMVDVNTGQKPSVIFDTQMEFDYINAGTSRSGYCESNNCDGDTVTTPSRGQGGIGFVGYQATPFWLGPLCYKLKSIDKSKLINKFLFYFLQSENKIILELKKEGGVPAVNKSDLEKLHVPIPPLYVQKEIVRILDKFTELTAELIAELTTELTARQKQYNYYRESLLRFEDASVEWKTLGEVGELVRGSGLPKSDFTETGIPAIHYGQIYTYYKTYATETKSFVSVETAKKLKKVDTGDVIITNTSENLEDVGKALVYLGKKQAVTGGHATIFKPSKRITSKYFAYFTQTEMFASQKRKLAKGIKVIDVSATDMSKIVIPIPSLKEQERIVSFLDKFDILTTSISEGLPKEIELRKKQYEYYRDLLLTFPKNNIES